MKSLELLHERGIIDDPDKTAPELNYAYFTSNVYHYYTGAYPGIHAG